MSSSLQRAGSAAARPLRAASTCFGSARGVRSPGADAAARASRRRRRTARPRPRPATMPEPHDGAEHQAGGPVRRRRRRCRRPAAACRSARPRAGAGSRPAPRSPAAATARVARRTRCSSRADARSAARRERRPGRGVDASHHGQPTSCPDRSTPVRDDPRPRLRRRRRHAPPGRCRRPWRRTPPTRTRRHAEALAALQHVAAPGAGGGGARRGRGRRARAGARQDLATWPTVLMQRPRRPHGAAGLHRHRRAAPRGTPRPGRCRSRPPPPPRSAVQDGAAALLVDVAGPVPFVVEGEDLARPGPRLDARRGSGRPGLAGDRRRRRE